MPKPLDNSVKMCYYQRMEKKRVIPLVAVPKDVWPKLQELRRMENRPMSWIVGRLVLEEYRRQTGEQSPELKDQQEDAA